MSQDNTQDTLAKTHLQLRPLIPQNRYDTTISQKGETTMDRSR